MTQVNKIKNIIAIASGKGGVGKSTIAVNYAFTLKKLGYAVGLLDMDLYGPSLSLLLGISNETKIKHDDIANMRPIMAYEIPTMSIGYLIDERAPAIWRGPIASKAVQQLFYNTQWGELDYLIIDLPPGTGDIHLTIAQKINLQGVIIVTTPQMISLADVRKAIMMLQKVNIKILGIVENMSSYQCSKCEHVADLFGAGGGLLLSKEYSIPLLGKIPFTQKIQEQSDKGKPIVLAAPDSLTSRMYDQIAQRLVKTIVENKMNRFPDIVVE